MNFNNQLNQSQNIKDYGNDPFIVNIDCLTKRNRFYRTALWTGDHLQVTLMSIPVGGDIGLEIHNNLDQFIRIESGTALAYIVLYSFLLGYIHPRAKNNKIKRFEFFGCKSGAFRVHRLIVHRVQRLQSQENNYKL